METWLANMLHIEEHNFEYALGRKTYSLGMNHYGDLTSDEFAKTYNGFLNSKKEMLPSKNSKCRYPARFMGGPRKPNVAVRCAL